MKQGIYGAGSPRCLLTWLHKNAICRLKLLQGNIGEARWERKSKTYLLIYDGWPNSRVLLMIKSSSRLWRTTSFLRDGIFPSRFWFSAALRASLRAFHVSRTPLTRSENRIIAFLISAAFACRLRGAQTTLIVSYPVLPSTSSGRTAGMGEGSAGGSSTSRSSSDSSLL